LSKGFDSSIKNPILFIPSLAPIVIQLLFLLLAYVVFPIQYNIFVYSAVLPWLIWGGYFIAALVGFVASCIVVDMINDKINGRQITLNKSFGVVMSRLGTLILAAVIAAVCFITFILIPVALFIITIAMVEGLGAIDSTKKAFDFVVKNLGEVIVFIVIVIVADLILSFGFGLIPFVGAYIGAIISWIAGVVFTVSSVHLYLALRTASPTVPPTPQPMPPPQLPT
jgi:MFS family permease